MAAAQASRVRSLIFLSALKEPNVMGTPAVLGGGARCNGRPIAVSAEERLDQALFDLYETGQISYEDALRNADSKNELRLKVKLQSKRENKDVDDHGSLQILEEDEGRSL